MSDQAVTNSTCLIALERIRQLGLLPRFFKSVFAPPAVQAEPGNRIEWLPIRQQIVTLNTHRKSLIHECLTGRWRLTGTDGRRANGGAATRPSRAGEYINNDVDFLWTSW